MEIEAHSSHNSHFDSDQTDVAASANMPPHDPDESTMTLALMPLAATKSERLVFSTRPEVLLDQAQRIEVWPLPEGEHTSIDASSTRSSHLLSSHLLMFARDMRESETVVGCELVAYPCDLNGRVVSWTHRFACCALNFPLASQKLRLQIVNDMATLHHIENLC